MLLVTGITGHTGNYFLTELINNSYEGKIRCLVRESSNTNKLDKSGLQIEKVVGDLNDKEFLYQSMDGVNTVLHIYNIHHSPLIVGAAIKKNVKRVILVHTTGIYSSFKNASKEYKSIERKVFQLIKSNENSPKITILRPTMIYGDLCDSNISKFIKLVDKCPIIPVIDKGENLIQPVNARDLAKVYYKVLKLPDITSGKTYDISGEKPIKLKEVLILITKELEKKRYFFNVNLKFGVLFAEMLKILTLRKINIVEKVQRMSENRSYSHLQAFKDIGYSPMKFKDGLAIEVKQYLGVTEDK